MATQVRNNSGGSIPIPGAYGGGSIRNSKSVVINDTISNVSTAFGWVAGDGISMTVVPDNQPGSLTPAGVSINTVFISAEQTGTGSAQNVAHGLGITPRGVFVAPTDTSPATVGVYTCTEGAHDATNVKVTVTSGKKFKVFAFA